MIILKNENGVVKKAPIGFSWTVLLFGFFVPLTRGDWKWTGVMALSTLVVGAITYGLGAWIVLFIFAFKYNEWYLDDLKERGYQVVG